MITKDKVKFENADCPKFSYSTENTINQHPLLSPHYLLFEDTIHKVEIDIFPFETYKAFFKSSPNSFFPFDIFAASFYLISRYEEYLSFNPDKLGRFDAKDSLAYKEGFLEQPLVNIWSDAFCKKLCEIFPSLKPKRTKFQFISTIDVDNAWAHLNKGLLRTFLSFTDLLFHFKFKKFIEKLRVIVSGKNDPYDNYGFLDEMHQKYNLKPIYFFLFSGYSQFDKSPSTVNKSFRQLIQNISKHNKLGIHPSFKSNMGYDALKKEKKQMEQLIQKEITISRQHYLFLKMPETYENLIKLGVKRDFSMGFSSHIGFRASFCLPFNFFNLKTDKETLLEIIPFELMDVCFRDYQKIMPEKALIKIKNIISSIKNVNGLFVSLWHNESLIKSDKQPDWRYTFEQMMIEVDDGN